MGGAASSETRKITVEQDAETGMVKVCCNPKFVYVHYMISAAEFCNPDPMDLDSKIYRLTMVRR